MSAPLAQDIVVAVVDDMPHSANQTADILDEAGYRTTLFTPDKYRFGEPSELLNAVVESGCTAAFVDHRLSSGGLAQFFGAEGLAVMYDAQLPGVLVSDFAVSDIDSTIRLYRDKVPSVVDRAKRHPDTLVEALSRCVAELTGDRAPGRRPWRSVVRVEDVRRDGSIYFAEAYVGTWDPDSPIHLPLELIADVGLRDHVRDTAGQTIRLLANVNIEAAEDRELFFTDFELAEPGDFDA